MSKELEDLRFIAESLTLKQWEKLTTRIENIRKALTTDRTLINTLHAFRNRWCKVKTAQELNEVCSYFINEVWKDFLKESEATK